MQFFKLLLPFLLLSSCAQKSTERPASPEVRKVTIRGMFEGQNDYRKWVVFLSKQGYTSPHYMVLPNGKFQMQLENLPKGKYQFNFGPRTPRKNGYWSFQIPVYKPVINLGWIPTTSAE